jgi:acetolactate synthase I/III small subunit
MPATFRETQTEQSFRSRFTMLELTVKNHAGIMSHVCGLLTRRDWPVEGMFSSPGPNAAHRRIWLLVSADQPLGQMIKQVAKLQDVLHVNHSEADGDVFGQLEQLISSYSSDQQSIHL